MKYIEIALGIHLLSSNTLLLIDRASGMILKNSALGWEINVWWINEIGTVLIILMLAGGLWLLDDGIKKLKS